MFWYNTLSRLLQQQNSVVLFHSPKLFKAESELLSYQKKAVVENKFLLGPTFLLSALISTKFVELFELFGTWGR